MIRFVDQSALLHQVRWAGSVVKVGLVFRPAFGKQRPQ